MKRGILLIVLCLLLSGCSMWREGYYEHVTPHHNQPDQAGASQISVSSYLGLCRALNGMVDNGMESMLISVAHYDPLTIARDTGAAVHAVMHKYPLGVYAVEDISYELGTSAGEAALSVKVTYSHDSNDLRKIHFVQTMKAARKIIESALNNFGASTVLYVQEFEDVDFTQWVADYAMMCPDRVMELPQVTVNLYPENESKDRVVELKFTYQTSRSDLRGMQQQVQEEVKQALSGIEEFKTERERCQAIYQYLIDRHEKYKQDTSITPAYHLLCHGVGDDRASATMYAALCRNAGMECITVTGTRNGRPRYWNIVKCDGVYYHMDPALSIMGKNFRLMCDDEMAGYVWDYSAYPQCGRTPETQDPSQSSDPTESAAAEATEPSAAETTAETENETQPAENTEP